MIGVANGKASGYTLDLDDGPEPEDDYPMAAAKMTQLIREWCRMLKRLEIDEQVAQLNAARKMIHDAGPFRREPVDLVEWVPFAAVRANDYNPNSVAPPEMELLRLSIYEDGYTQPIVGWRPDDGSDAREVVDGFHRNRVGRECAEVTMRIHGYLPLTTINADREDRGDRIASTIRHNRARGKHAVAAMSDIVIELKRRNWSDEKIARELGMDQDEILRLCQISGLAELFTDQQFSEAWDIEGEVTANDFKELTDELPEGPDTENYRAANTSDENRVFHTYDKWECYKAGFYATTVSGMTKDQAESKMAQFLCNLPAFRKALKHVTDEWVHSCEHYLTNTAMNRIAWLGQAAVCYALGIPAAYRGGWFIMTKAQQEAACKVALAALNRWAKKTGRGKLTLEEAAPPDREVEIY